MTLCIAAECMYEEKYAIVLCRDWQANKGQITSDDADKLRDIDEGELGCRVLLAGSPTRADHLITACEPAIRSFMGKTNPDDTDLDTDRLLQDLRDAAKLARRGLVNDWVSTTLNMDFEEFRKHGRSELLESHYHDVWETIRRYDIGAELLITLFDASREPVIIRMDGMGDALWESDYSTIGTGGPTARAFLCQVDWPGEMPLGECMYEVLRAKFAAEKTRDVGRGTTVNISVEGRKHYLASQKGFEFYQRRLMPYKTPKLRFDPSFIEDDSDHEPASDKQEPPTRSSE